jgi:hypothetical protein
MYDDFRHFWFLAGKLCTNQFNEQREDANEVRIQVPEAIFILGDPQDYSFQDKHI